MRVPCLAHRFGVVVACRNGEVYCGGRSRRSPISLFGGCFANANPTIAANLEALRVDVLFNARGKQLDMRKAPLRPIDPGTRIGHVHLKVADLERALAFYSGVLGFEITQRWGTQAAFLSAGGYHHHIGLNTWESFGGQTPGPNTTGLYHLAVLYPTRSQLADALRRVLAAGIHLDGASDHGVSEALYLRDPDQNGVELYWDRPKDEWPYDANGQLAMYSRRLDLRALLGDAPSPNLQQETESQGTGP